MRASRSVFVALTLSSGTAGHHHRPPRLLRQLSPPQVPTTPAANFKEAPHPPPPASSSQPPLPLPPPGEAMLTATSFRALGRAARWSASARSAVRVRGGASPSMSTMANPLLDQQGLPKFDSIGRFDPRHRSGAAVAPAGKPAVHRTPPPHPTTSPPPPTTAQIPEPTTPATPPPRLDARQAGDGLGARAA